MNFGGVEFSINAEWWQSPDGWRARVTTGRGFLGRQTVDSGRNEERGPSESASAARASALLIAHHIAKDAAEKFFELRREGVAP
jgi:hypothetical protein